LDPERSGGAVVPVAMRHIQRRCGDHTAEKDSAANFVDSAVFLINDPAHNESVDDNSPRAHNQGEET
jgi:hypothetical protein